MRYSDSPILITGAARSGTSMVAACINLCGAWKGDTVGPSKYNRKGMYENYKLRQEVMKPLLHSIKADQRGQYPLPETKDVIIPYDIKEVILNIIRKQGWREDQPWMWKCAKMSLMWPVWKYAFPDSKWVIVRRRSGDIVNSCMHTGFMTAFASPKIQKEVGVTTERDGWLWWVNKHLDKFREIQDSGVNVKIVWPERMVEGNYQQMKETIEWLGLKWDGPAVMNFIEPKLWKARRK